jgi:hypothetical protein
MICTPVWDHPWYIYPTTQTHWITNYDWWSQSCIFSCPGKSYKFRFEIWRAQSLILPYHMLVFYFILLISFRGYGKNDQKQKWWKHEFFQLFHFLSLKINIIPKNAFFVAHFYMQSYHTFRTWSVPRTGSKSGKFEKRIVISHRLTCYIFWTVLENLEKFQKWGKKCINETK